MISTWSTVAMMPMEATAAAATSAIAPRLGLVGMATRDGGVVTGRRVAVTAWSSWIFFTADR